MCRRRYAENYRPLLVSCLYILRIQMLSFCTLDPERGSDVMAFACECAWCFSRSDSGKVTKPQSVRPKRRGTP